MIRACDRVRQFFPAHPVYEVDRQYIPLAFFHSNQIPKTESFSVCNKLFHRQYRNRKRHKQRAGNDHCRGYCPLGPSNKMLLREPFNRNRAGTQQERKNRKHIIHLGILEHINEEKDNRRPAEKTVFFRFLAEKQVSQSAQPQRECEWIQADDQLRQECKRRQRKILILGRITHKFECRPAVIDLPHHVRQKYYETNDSAGIHPERFQDLPSLGYDERKQ